MIIFSMFMREISILKNLIVCYHLNEMEKRSRKGISLMSIFGMFGKNCYAEYVELYAIIDSIQMIKTARTGNPVII